MDSEWFSYNQLDYGGQCKPKQRNRKKTPAISFNWEGFLVESGKAVETAVGITVSSDDDAFVEEHDNNIRTLDCFQLFEYLEFFKFLIACLGQNCYQ